jgi:hypothetical protein
MSTGSGWLGRYLDTLPRPLDAWRRGTRQAKHHGRFSPAYRCTGDSERKHILVRKPNRGQAALQERAAAQTMAGNPAAGRPHLAYLNDASRGAIETLDRVALASQYTPTVVYPNNGFAGSLTTIAGAIRARHRLASVLGDHRRLRHPRGSGRSAVAAPTPT